MNNVEGKAGDQAVDDEGARWHRRLAYHSTKWAFVVLFKVLFRISIEGQENIPDGACVWAPNHRSYIDTPVQAIVPRRLRFMGKDSMWNNRFFGWIFTTIGGFPVTRGTADRGALNTALDVLRAGTDPVVAYPEGERKDGPRIHPLFDGAAYMAAKAQVPIVPVGIAGSANAMPRGAKMLRPRKVHVVIGQPLDPPALSGKGRVSRKEVRAVTEQLRDEIQSVFDRAMLKAGTPNVYEPGSEPLPEHVINSEIVAPTADPKTSDEAADS